MRHNYGAVAPAGERSSRHCPSLGGVGKRNFSATTALIAIVISLGGHDAACPHYYCKCITGLVRLGTFYGTRLGPWHLDHGMVARIGLARPGGKARTVRQGPPGRPDGVAYRYAARTTLRRDHFAAMQRQLCCASEERRASGAYFKKGPPSPAVETLIEYHATLGSIRTLVYSVTKISPGRLSKFRPAAAHAERSPTRKSAPRVV
jgi:hypothetical protein